MVLLATSTVTRYYVHWTVHLMLSAVLPRIRMEFGKAADRLRARAFVTAMIENKSAHTNLRPGSRPCDQSQVDLWNSVAELEF